FAGSAVGRSANAQLGSARLLLVRAEQNPRQNALTTMVRVTLPLHLRTLAKIDGEALLNVAPPITQRTILDALEARYPMLRGTIRDHVTQRRRAFLRFFACNEDFSNDLPDAMLPEAVASGSEPFMVVGAIAGG